LDALYISGNSSLWGLKSDYAEKFCWSYVQMITSFHPRCPITVDANFVWVGLVGHQTSDCGKCPS